MKAKKKRHKPPEVRLFVHIAGADPRVFELRTKAPPSVVARAVGVAGEAFARVLSEEIARGSRGRVVVFPAFGSDDSA